MLLSHENILCFAQCSLNGMQVHSEQQGGMPCVQLWRGRVTAMVGTQGVCSLAATSGLQQSKRCAEHREQSWHCECSVSEHIKYHTHLVQRLETGEGAAIQQVENSLSLSLSRTQKWTHKQSHTEAYLYINATVTVVMKSMQNIYWTYHRNDVPNY